MPAIIPHFCRAATIHHVALSCGFLKVPAHLKLSYFECSAGKSTISSTFEGCDRGHTEPAALRCLSVEWLLR